MRTSDKYIIAKAGLFGKGVFVEKLMTIEYVVYENKAACRFMTSCFIEVTMEKFSNSATERKTRFTTPGAIF
jgi:hypothetical protein